MSEDRNEVVERVNKLSDRFFLSVKDPQERTVARFTAFVGVSYKTYLSHFPKGDWVSRRDGWIRLDLVRAMDELMAEGKTRREFGFPLIRERVRVTRWRMIKLAGDEYRRRKALLPTAREIFVKTLEAMKARGAGVEEFTRVKVLREAGVAINDADQWMLNRLRAARLEAAGRVKEVQPPPPGAHAFALRGGVWVDLDADTWDLRPGGGDMLRRDKLRPDMADLAWEILRNELELGRLSPGTVTSHHQAFRTLAKMLSDEVPDVRRATLEGVQRAWTRFRFHRYQRAALRKSMEGLFGAILEEAGAGRSGAGSEAAKILGWLGSIVVSGRQHTDGVFLDANELEAVITACLGEIKAGLDFIRAGADLTKATISSNATEGARVVVYWGVALMILLCAFTGLRRLSLTTIGAADWVELREGLFALAWRHPKTGREALCFLPAPLARQLSVYVRHTESVRRSLRTDSVFLFRDGVGDWCAVKEHQVYSHFRDFVTRHGLEREGRPLSLNNAVLRRTYTTRELYGGRALSALSFQLGHARLSTTERYAKFDLYEHPAQVKEALDGYGRVSLSRWREPVMLDGLGVEERVRLLGAAAERDQKVGLCGHDRCVEAEAGSPPPCSLCPHLVTGRRFLPAWEEERRARESELEALSGRPELSHLSEQKRLQYRIFVSRLEAVRGK